MILSRALSVIDLENFFPDQSVLRNQLSYFLVPFTSAYFLDMKQGRRYAFNVAMSDHRLPTLGRKRSSLAS
jgi:hypothetical protein